LTHQNVVMSVNALLRRAYAVICLPGSDQSFVESEVAFATASHRTVLFVVPRGGTLPNTADKRHPVFVQELAAARAYAPVTALLHYLVQDLSSTLQLYQRAWSPRVGLFSPKALLLATTLAAIVFFVLTALEAHVATAGLVHTDVPSAEGLRWKVVLTVAALLSIGALLLLLIANVLLLVSRSLWVQFRASRRAALRAQAGEFTRADWVELVPGMQPGDPVYESMYENAPRAHHESGQGSRRRKPWAG